LKPSDGHITARTITPTHAESSGHSVINYSVSDVTKTQATCPDCVVDFGRSVLRAMSVGADKTAERYL